MGGVDGSDEQLEVGHLQAQDQAQDLARIAVVVINRCITSVPTLCLAPILTLNQGEHPHVWSDGGEGSTVQRWKPVCDVHGGHDQS